jgi:hypothetical protein
MMEPSGPDVVEETRARSAVAGHAGGSEAVVAGNGGGAADMLSLLIWLVSVCMA